MNVIESFNVGPFYGGWLYEQPMTHVDGLCSGMNIGVKQ